ncbi:MAG: adenosine kinase [Nanoarchaeota archaeon]
MRYNIIGLGNPLVDILLHVEDPDIQKMGLQKGTMQLTEQTRIEQILSLFPSTKRVITAGGSVANTLAIASQCGSDTKYIGMACHDEYARLFSENMTDANVYCDLLYPDQEICVREKTGRVLSLITPDSERTMLTYLGASQYLGDRHIQQKNLTNAQVLHLTAYTLEDDSLFCMTKKAAQLAVKNGLRVSLDLADPLLVKRIKRRLQEFVSSFVDILFANEKESVAFTDQPDPDSALRALGTVSTIAVLKLGEKGAVVRHQEVNIPIKAYKTNAVDTTGAGDAFAGGFLFAVCRDISLEAAGKIGAYMASQVVATTGAQLDDFCPEDLMDALGPLR